MDLRKLKTLIELVESSGIAVEVSEGESACALRAPCRCFIMLSVRQQAGPASTSPRRSPDSRRRRRPAEGHAVKAPMVGTFSLRPAPRPSWRSGMPFNRAIPVHHRGNEAHERDRGRGRRQGDPRRKRTSGRIRSTPCHHSLRRSPGASGRRAPGRARFSAHCEA